MARLKVELGDRIIERRKVCSPETGRCTEVEVMFDSGSTHSLIRKDVVARDFPDSTVIPSNKTAGAYDGKAIVRSLGQVVLRVEVERGKPLAQETFEILSEMKQEAVFGASGMETNEVDIRMRQKKAGGSIVKYKGKGPAQIQPGGIELTER